MKLLYLTTFISLLSSGPAPAAVTVEKIEDIKDNIFISSLQCTTVSTDLWTGKHRIMETEQYTAYCTPKDFVAKCDFMDSKQKIYASELFDAAISGKRFVITNDFTTIVGDLDSHVIHSEVSSSLRDGRIQLKKVCTGGWGFEGQLRKQAEEEDKAQKILKSEEEI